MLNRLISLAQAIQQIPAPTGAEAQRAAFVRARFADEGLAVEMDAAGNVYARVPGNQNQTPPIVVSAHLDTVFPAKTPLRLREEGDRLFGPGIGDNSVAVAALFGLLWQLRHRSPLPTDLWLVANVGEEGLGNLKGMKAVVRRFGEAGAYIVLEGLGLGWVYNRGLGVRRYTIRVRTRGGHAWGNASAPSAIHTLAAIVARLDALPRPEHTSLNVGVCQGGTSINTIAAEARAEIDLRAVAPGDLEHLAHAVEAECRRFRKHDVAVTVEPIGERPAGQIPPSHPLVRAALHALQRHGIRGRLAAASTDANAPLSQGYPAICMGLTTGGGAHTAEEFIHIQPLTTGIAALTDTVAAIAARLS